MAKYELRFLPEFEDNLYECASYIQNVLQNPQAAENLISEVQKAIYDRLEMPEAFEKVRSNKHRQYPYYRIYVKNYTILYVVIGNIMEVRHMFYSRRDIQSLI